MPPCEQLPGEMGPGGYYGHYQASMSLHVELLSIMHLLNIYLGLLRPLHHEPASREPTLRDAGAQFAGLGRHRIYHVQAFDRCHTR